MQTKTVAGRTWHFSHPIGWLSARGRGFWHPTSVATTSEGTIYVLNSGGRAGAPITVATIDEEYVGEFGDGDFTWPEGLAIDQDGNIYCADGFEHFVNVYSSEGEHLAKWGEHGTDEGLLNRPAGLAFDSDDNLWIVDSQNARVQQFTRMDSSSLPGVSRAARTGSSTAPGESRSTRTATSTSRIGAMTEFKSSHGTASS